ncbi:hypothetical protein [Pedobacter sp. V48]|uniref:hypothetical protein n=1 Tax=Pedobacter sp. V48 TaxID=509635 RepID=UPI0003E53DE6|nr:hypothetical protein [Pedobacter sp. V48]ETZ22423.1 hypothetical protein N824_01880 [Pedobacter sp. V48]
MIDKNRTPKDGNRIQAKRKDQGRIIEIFPNAFEQFPYAGTFIFPDGKGLLSAYMLCRG